MPRSQWKSMVPMHTTVDVMNSFDDINVDTQDIPTNNVLEEIQEPVGSKMSTPFTTADTMVQQVLKNKMNMTMCQN